jgi:chorismate--pyruvate lyase
MAALPLALDVVEREWSGDALAGGADSGLTPCWLVLVFSDGSPTRQLTLTCGCVPAVCTRCILSLRPPCQRALALSCRSPVTVDVIPPTAVARDSAGTPAEVAAFLGPAPLQRDVWLSNARGDRLGHAVSWWASADFAAFLPDPSRPIGSSMAAARLEVYRELLSVRCGSSSGLEAAFGSGLPASHTRPARLWERTYAMWHGGRRITVIRETFSPSLEQWLGNASNEG